MSVTTTPASLTVAGGSLPRAMGIAAPADTLYPASKLRVTVTGLPTDGAVYISDGVTPVLPGELLSVAELTGLTFAGGANATGQSAQFTYDVIDPAGTSATGTATLSVIANTSGPQTTPASLTVAANSGPTAINITAPTDPNDPTGALTITVLGLPSDGNVFLADGLTAVTAGQSLTVAQLTGLKFASDTGVVAQSTLFSYAVNDPAGNSSLGSAVLSIAPAGNILTVGQGKQYSTIAAAIGASHNGDTIQVQAGTYVNDFAVINTNITLESVGGMVNMVSTGLIPNGKGILVTNGDITINNFSFSGARVTDQNGAGIRYQIGNLILNNDAFFNNEMGLLGGGANPGIGTITINNSEFADNGVEVPTADIFGHNIYVGNIAMLTINNSYIHDAKVGHEIKSRAHNTTIQNSRIYDGPSGTGSYSIDLPNGGNGVIRNNVIEQGPVSENPKIIGFGEEGGVYPSSSLTISGNTILNDETSPLLLYNPTTVTAQITGNQFFGLTSTQIASGPNVQSNNQFLASEPALDTTRPWSPEIVNFPSNSNPTITSNGGGATASVSIAENTTAVTTVVATDPDAGQSLSYSIAGSVDAALFTINTATGALAFVTAPDFEAPTDAGTNNIYDLSVQVSDGNGGIDTQAIAVTVQNMTGAIINGTNAPETLTGTGEEDFIYGLGGNDTLQGLAGNDTLDGGVGADTLIGGLGSDTYIVDNAGDVVTELAGAGADTVLTTLNSYTLGSNVENLVFTGAGTFAGTGNALANSITGGTGNDTLNGGSGADTMIGGTGDDTYVVDNVGDAVSENPGEGSDTVKTVLASYTLPGAVENLVYTGAEAFAGTGNGLDNSIIGGVGADKLNGGIGADTLIGGAGNDTYIVDNAGDVVSENPGGGTDTVKTALASYTLGSDVENLVYTGAGNFSGTGNGLADGITGGAGNDTLDGGAGADTMIGGLGNDTYIVDNAGDVVTEAGAAGTDTVLTTLNSYTLTAGVEVLTFNGAGDFAGTGNGLANTLTGGTGNDILNGGIGADRMIGGIGDDTYVADNVGDAVSENAGEGNDTVLSSITYTLGANLENLTQSGIGNIGSIGNAANNLIIGNAGNNLVAGLGGADALDGGAGTDTATYAASAAGVSVSLATGLGSGGDAEGDTLVNVENLTGSSFNDTLEGDAGNNVLAAGAGTDNASYQHATAGVTVNLAVAAAQNTVAAGTDTLTGFENLTGSAFDDALTGSSGANTLMGLDGNDTLNGGAGADILTGGAGADRFVYGATADSSPGAPDNITDFSHGADVIDLSAIDANASLTGNQAFGFADLNPNVAAHSVTWSESGGNTIIRADVSGDSTADLMLVLTGTNLHLAGSDFIL